MMKILLDDVVAALNGCWLARVPPHQLSKLSQPLTTRGITSVLLASSPAFDQDHRQLCLDADHVVLLNLGTSPRTFVIDTIVGSDVVVEAQAGSERPERDFGPGDREFLQLVEGKLRRDAQEVAVDLIREVRQRWPGDLKRGQRNNFSNTPDNFWYVVVQPRAQSLSITLRGAPDRFRSNLALRMDRPGYTRFTINDISQLPEALRLIEQSKRK
jgi:hypothetical protein